MQHEHFFKCKLDCIIWSKNRLDLLQFSETIHKNIFMKRTADKLNETQIHSLPAGGTSSLSLVSGVNIHVQFISSVQLMYCWSNLITRDIVYLDSKGGSGMFINRII